MDFHAYQQQPFETGIAAYGKIRNKRGNGKGAFPHARNHPASLVTPQPCGQGAIMSHFDWNGAAVFLGAFGAFLGTIATLAMQIITWRDNRRGREAAERRERTLNAVAQASGVQPEEPNGKNP